MDGMRHRWEFPLPRTHTGMLLGNGRMGAMVWGEGGVLRITIGRADFWDHRGAMGWTEEMSYATVKKYLVPGNDQKGLSKLLTPPLPEPGMPRKPSILPVGRIELDFGGDATLLHGELDMAAGEVKIACRQAGRIHSILIVHDIERDVLCISLPEGLKKPRISRVPAWKYVKNDMEKIGFAPPSLFSAGKNIAGWVQNCPSDPSLCLAYRLENRELFVATASGNVGAGAKRNTLYLLEEAGRQGSSGIRKSCGAWWKEYWEGVPRISIPNKCLEFLYTYGMYKFAGLTNPSGVPATLQGPWVEEYQMPPWSNDYHFNINVQMCYLPAYHGNKTVNLLPLFEMIWSWRETLRHNARMFLGIDDGFMLPHSTDDRAGCIGGYWAGSIDHGSTCWMALMMHRYYRYTMDRDFLQRLAYPFMCGAMRVFEEMLEYKNGRYALPVSISPEYVDKSGRNWGKNSSFQLACIHALCEALVSSAEVLGEKKRPVWKEILKKLPKASLVEAGPFDRKDKKMIGIWKGVPLQESHRHHSHLAGITPFDIFDPEDTQCEEIIRCSLNHWLYHGAGLWSGWCVPWASMIQSRMGNGDAAELYLEIFDRVFTNMGHGTLHDCGFPGFSLMGRDSLGKTRRYPEIMQMDGGMGAVAAIQEMLLHVRRGVTYIFRGTPESWKDVSFTGMLTDGAFLVSAVREKGQVRSVIVKSLKGGTFRLANPWGNDRIALKESAGKPKILSGKVLSLKIRPSATLILNNVRA